MGFNIHLGSTGCMGNNAGPVNPCSAPNVGEVSLDTGEPVQERELVVTGGIERSIMPPGNQIPVGTVDKVTPDEAARVQILQIGYSVDFSQLDVVQVVKWVPET
jgi:cell shape-determining protein MreC